MTPETLYPPSPTNVPPQLTTVTPGYRLRVLLTIVSLIFFLAVYAALFYLAWIVAVWLWNWDMEVEGRGVLLYLIAKYGGLLATGLFVAFLIRGLVKRHRVQEEGWVELRPEQAPSLHAFVHRLCDELGAPRPQQIILSPDVNAALVYDTSLINLIVPPKKKLLIGLGLVNVLNLSEFKAVLAHEFGHFSQKSTGLDSYVYVAHRVIYDLLYGRDKLDELLEAWGSADLRLSFPALILMLALRLSRGLLALVYRVILRAHRSLMRQMEFNADDAAVVAAGSDAIIFGLYKLEFAESCLEQAVALLGRAAEQGVFTDDLFYHQTKMADRLRLRSGNPRLGLPPELPDDPTRTVQVFEPDEKTDTDPYSTHPSHYQRELNAKRFYVRCPIDRRSAWLLFDRAETVRTQVTMAFYRELLKRPPQQVKPAREVQRLLEAELVALETLERYEGVYDDRIHFPVALDELPRVADLSEEAIGAFLDSWPDEDAISAAKRYHTAHERYRMLRQALAHARLAGSKQVEIGTESIPLKEAKQQLEECAARMRAAETVLHRKDTTFLHVHVCLARQLDQQAHWLEKLLARLRFQQLIDRLVAEAEELEVRYLELLADAAETVRAAPHKKPEKLLQKLVPSYQELQRGLEKLCMSLHQTAVPEMANISAGTRLSALAADPIGPYPVPQDPDRLDSDDLLKLMEYAGDLWPRLAWVRTKAIAALLKDCERIAALWRAQRQRSEPARQRPRQPAGDS